jgi:hypothetical protein
MRLDFNWVLHNLTCSVISDVRLKSTIFLLLLVFIYMLFLFLLLGLIEHFL